MCASLRDSVSIYVGFLFSENTSLFYAESENVKQSFAFGKSVTYLINLKYSTSRTDSSLTVPGNPISAPLGQNGENYGKVYFKETCIYVRGSDHIIFSPFFDI